MAFLKTFTDVMGGALVGAICINLFLAIGLGFSAKRLWYPLNNRPLPLNEHRLPLQHRPMLELPGRCGQYEYVP